MPDDLRAGYEKQMDSLLGTLPGTDYLRAQAIRAFGDQGFPAAKDENWRYSDIRSLKASVFSLAGSPAAAPTVPAALTEASARFVFVNGRYEEELSDMGDLWQAASIRPLANHFMSNAERAGELVCSGDAPTLLNTALMRDGIVLQIPAGIEIDDPIEIIHIMTDAAGAAAHTRHVIELGEGAAALIVERFIGDGSASWTNTLLQARVSEGASLRHVRLQEEGENAFHTAAAFVNVGAEGRYDCCNLSLGGRVARFEAHVKLMLDQSSAHIDGVALAATGQSHDTLTHISHNMPHTTSDQVFRTVADSRGKTSFQGKVTVAKDAQKVEADQSFKALVFDRTAEANAKPELEIFADDVKCSHGATVGDLDEKAIFYLTSRGIDPATARQMLVEAFTSQALERVGNDDIKATMMDKINAWMAARKDKDT